MHDARAAKKAKQRRMSGLQSVSCPIPFWLSCALIISLNPTINTNDALHSHYYETHWLVSVPASRVWRTTEKKILER